MVVSMLIFLFDYIDEYIEGMDIVRPRLLYINRNFSTEGLLIDVGLRKIPKKVPKSPLFNAMKSRFHEVFKVEEPMLLSIESINNHTTTQGDYWSQMDRIFKNHTFTYMDKTNDSFRIVTVDCDVESGVGVENSFFSRIHVLVAPFNSSSNSKIHLKASFIIPGIVLHS
jgi:hypothetical protein